MRNWLPASVKNHRSSPPSRLEAHTRTSSTVPFTTSLQHPARQIPIRSVLPQITTGSYRNIQLTLDCVALVLNLSVYTGESMAGIGRRLKISREAVSKHCKKISKDFNIPLSRAMRSQTSVACAKREICWKSRSGRSSLAVPNPESRTPRPNFSRPQLCGLQDLGMERNLR